MKRIYIYLTLTLFTTLLSVCAATSVTATGTTTARNAEDRFAEVYNVKDFGAVGDGTTDDTAAIQAAINASAAHQYAGTIIFPQPQSTNNFYRINSTIKITNDFTTLDGINKSTIIKYCGTGNAIEMYGGAQSIKNLSVWGLGGDHGVGASNAHGIVVGAGASGAYFENVQSWYHGQHGWFFTGSTNHGNNTHTFVNCSGAENFGDGLNARSPAGDQQYGNAIRIFGGQFSDNTGNGINWNAAALLVSGCVVEGNKGAGIMLDSATSTTYVGGNVDIHGCYFEVNLNGQIRIVTGAGLYGANISGNFMQWIEGYGTSLVDALIEADGAAGAIQLTEIGQNTYLYPTGTNFTQVTKWVDLGNKPTGSCTVNTMGNPSQFVNLGSAITSSSYLRAVDMDTSSELAGILTDETGTGAAVFGTSPTIVTPTIASFANANHNHQNSAGGGSLDAAAIGSGTIAAARQPALTGDVTSSSGSVATTIANDAVTTSKILNSNVTLAKLANIANGTVLGNSSGGSAAPSALGTLPTTVQNNITRLGSISTGIGIFTSPAGTYETPIDIDIPSNTSSYIKLRNTVGGTDSSASSWYQAGSDYAVWGFFSTTYSPYPRFQGRLGASLSASSTGILFDFTSSQNLQWWTGGTQYGQLDDKGVTLSGTAKYKMAATMTSSGTTGNQTINKPSGSVRIASGNSSVTVTNSCVTTSSIVLTQMRTADGSVHVLNCIVASGSFTINLTANAGTEDEIGFVVVN